MSQTKDKIFGVLQRIGRSFMLPIAILPIAGLLLGIGSSFTNETMLSSYGLSGIIYPGSYIYSFLNVISEAGSVIFDNLALLFAMGVAIGMAKHEKEVAALSGAVAFLVMNITIEAMIANTGGVGNMLENSTGEVLGITTLQMGVFGGIIVGLGVAALHNRFYKIQFPRLIAFFGGTRFVPIISSAVYILVGIAMFYVWPITQKGISALGGLVLSSGYFGTWIYGIIERALIPFGLHHVFYIPFWQTSVGGSQVIDGALIQGAQNIFFAQLASKNTVAFNTEATRFMAGKFPFMIFGLPGAALAMYQTSKPHKKKVAGGLLLSAALTSAITGITEPLEFTFIFAAPLMYGVHCILAGLSFMLMHIFKVGVGMTFSGGLIDLFLFGILQGNAKTNWIYIVIVGLVYFVLYYIIFGFMIKKFNYATPGRETDNDETKLYTREDYNTAKSQKSTDKNRISRTITEGLGGKDNISDIDCCATRLRITVENPELLSKDILDTCGASGIIIKGNAVQIIFGPTVSVIKSNLNDYLHDLPPSVPAAPPHGDKRTSITHLNQKQNIFMSPLDGEAIPLNEVNDDVFSAGILGQGIGIIPKSGTVYAPCDGKVTNTVETGHAIGITTNNNQNILIHVGLDTVKLKGKYFKYLVNNNTKVKVGDPIMEFDFDAVINAEYDITTPVIFTDISCNDEKTSISVLCKYHETINHGTPIIEY